MLFDDLFFLVFELVEGRSLLIFVERFYYKDIRLYIEVSNKWLLRELKII